LAESIIEQVAEQSKKPGNEIKKLVEEKKKKFSGLLTDSGAAYMVAKDLGINLVVESSNRLNVSKLKDGMQNVDLLVRVMQVFSPKKFEKNGRKGKLCSLIVADNSGETRLTVWHDDVKKLSEKQVRRGSVLLLHNCYVKSFNEKTQLSLSYKGEMLVNPKNISFEGLPEAKSELTKLSKLGEGMDDVNALARIVRIFPATEFEKADRKGRVMNFLIVDETGSVRATAWNDLVEVVSKLQENSPVRIEGAYTKPGLKGTELHLGWRARIEKLSESETEIPSSAELLLNKTKKKKIVGLQPANDLVLIEGTIVAVNPGALYYNICPKCGGKVQRLDEGMLCDKCGEVKQPDIRPVISFKVDDGSAQIDAVAYGKEAEKIIGLDKEELKKQAADRGRETLIEELQEMAGKPVKVVGKAKENSFSNQLEISASLVELK